MRTFGEFDTNNKVFDTLFIKINENKYLILQSKC